MSGARDATADLARFAAELSLHRPPFSSDREIRVARAPGRLDVMGGIADYSGSLVLQLPIREATLVAVQPGGAPSLRLHSALESVDGEVRGRRECVEIPLDALRAGDDPLDYASARRHFAADPERHWSAYVAGVWLVLAREIGLRLGEGATVEVRSCVPVGKGVSSSAALEVATMRAVCAAYDVSLSGSELARLCQRVENRVAGAPCGIMDQMTSALGECDQLLALLCRPAQIEGQLEVPREVAFAGIDSGVRHAVGGASYDTVRCAAFMGRRIIAEHRGLAWLSECPPEALEPASGAAGRIELPDAMPGRDFLERFGDHGDEVTAIDAQRSYPVRAATRYPIEEHRRAQRFARRLRSPLSEVELQELGQLMLASHRGYSECGLGTEATDRLVELALVAGLAGARITGGGSGGTVAMLGWRDRIEEAVAQIAAQREAETGERPQVFLGSSPGAMSVEVARVPGGGGGHGDGR